MVSCSPKAINRTIFSSITVVVFIVFNDSRFCLRIFIFAQNTFQRISVILCLLIQDVLKIVYFFYSGFTLQQNCTLQQNNKLTDLFIFTSVPFGVFDIIYFRLALKALGIGQFSRCMCCKNEMEANVLSLKSPNVSKFYPNSLKLCTCREI